MFFLGELHAEFLANRRQEFDGCQLWIENERNVYFRGNLPKQGSNQRCLACPNLSCELDKAATFSYAIDKVRQTFAMTLTHEQVAWIRRDRKGFFVESKKSCVHSRAQIRSDGPILPELIGIQCSCSRNGRIAEAIAYLVDGAVKLVAPCWLLGCKKIELRILAEFRAAYT